MQELRRQWGKNIEITRRARGLLQYQLADLIGVRPASVCRWETGVAAPTDEHKVAIATALEVDVRQLFPLTRPMALR